MPMKQESGGAELSGQVLASKDSEYEEPEVPEDQTGKTPTEG
jgi:hypothetical protein